MTDVPVLPKEPNKNERTLPLLNYLYANSHRARGALVVTDH